MSTFREISLGAAAIEYIRERLANGNTLARNLLQRTDLDAGRVVTFLPPSIRDEAAWEFVWEFKEGQLPEPPPESHRIVTEEDGTKSRMVPTPDTTSIIVEIVKAFLTAEGDRLCLFEDALARADDPLISSADTRILIFKDEVYHFLSHEDAKSEQILKTTKRATTAWQCIGAMTHVSKEDCFSPETGRISSQELTALAGRAEKIVVGAFDGEGCLIWSRP